MKIGLAAVVPALLLVGLVAGCGRHVVLDPETVDDVNDRAWTLKSEPRRASDPANDAGASAIVPVGTVAGTPTQPPPPAPPRSH